MSKNLKSLPMYARQESYIDSNGNSRTFTKYYVVVNGIEIQVTLTRGDSTGREILKRHFEVEL